jgi:hypothetical protein
MLTLTEWMELTGNEIDLDESLGRKGWVKGVALVLTARALSHRNAVKSATDTNAKLDALADLITTNSYLSTLSIATELNDRSLLRGKGAKR